MKLKTKKEVATGWGRSMDARTDKRQALQTWELLRRLVALGEKPEDLAKLVDSPFWFFEEVAAPVPQTTSAVDRE